MSTYWDYDVREWVFYYTLGKDTMHTAQYCKRELWASIHKNAIMVGICMFSGLSVKNPTIKTIRRGMDPLEDDWALRLCSSFLCTETLPPGGRGYS